MIREYVVKVTDTFLPGAFQRFESEWAPEQELIRCKDCKHWSAERINDFNKCRRWINVGVKNFATMDDWFCADGECKDGEQDD